MTCPCGYYGSCSEFCTPWRRDRIIAERKEIENWLEEQRKLQEEFGKDFEEAREERYS